MIVSRWEDTRLFGCFSQMNLVLLDSSESGLQHILNGSIASACDIAGMKISTSKTEVLHLSRNPVQSSPVGKVTLKQMEKFKYFGVTFTSDRRRDEKLEVNQAKQVL